MTNQKPSFGDRLREIRKSKNLPLELTARRAGITPSYLARLERGAQPPPPHRRIRAIARAVGEDPTELIALSGRIPEDMLEDLKDPRVLQEVQDLIRRLRSDLSAC